MATSARVPEMPLMEFQRSLHDKPFLKRGAMEDVDPARRFRILTAQLKGSQALEPS